MTTNYEELEKLTKLKEQGILSDKEFEKEKEKILNGDSLKTDSTKQIDDKLYYDNLNVTFLEKIFSSKGRLNRKEFFIYNLLLSGLSQFLAGLVFFINNCIV